MFVADTDKRFRVIIYGIVAVSVCLFIAFVYIYPKVFPHIDRAQPENYRENVQAALAKGDTESALAIASFAARHLTYDLEPATYYGELLTKYGDTQSARRQLESVLRVTTTPSPEFRPTRLPYFHARARLALGALSLREGDYAAAIRHFELARPLADLASEPYREYRAALHEAYKSSGHWSRALQFGDIDAAALTAMQRQDLLRLCAAAEADQQWDLLRRAGARLTAITPADASASYASGRSALALNQIAPAIELLSAAAQAGHRDGAFFLGAAYEAAGQGEDAFAAYMAVPSESIYFPFALGKALVLAQQRDAPAGTANILEALEAAINSACPISLVETPGILPLMPQKPRAIGLDPNQLIPGAVPTVTLWLDARSFNEPFEANLESVRYMVLRVNAKILQFEWAHNLAPLAYPEPLDDSIPAGFVHPASAWGDQTILPLGQVVRSDQGPAIKISSDAPVKTSMLSTPPVPVEVGDYFALVCRVLAPRTPAVVGWRFLDETETVAAAGDALNQRVVPEWSWVGAATQVQYPWTLMEGTFGLYEAAGEALFDKFALLQIRLPLAEVAE